MPSMVSMTRVMTVAVQEEWPFDRFDATQAFLQSEMGTGVHMRLPERCYTMADMIVKLEKSIHGIKQAGRQVSRPLCRASLKTVGMVQYEADPCVSMVKDTGD